MSGDSQESDDDTILPVEVEHVLAQMRDANERLVLATIRADELADEAREARATTARYAETLETQDRAKDEFLAMLAHELRNPLSPILTTLDVMELSAPEVFTRERTLLQGQVKQLVRIVDDLLDISRVNQGKIVLEREPVEVAAIVARAVDTVSPLIEHNAHALHVEVPERGLVVDGDFVRLAQVVGNLLTNAAKYTPARGRIEVVAERRGSAVAVRVVDDGIGISAEMLHRVFDLFAQDHRTLDRSQGGLGLGLTIVQRLVRMHGGTITARSEGTGKGSVFEIVLPLSARPAPAAYATARIGVPVRPGIRVLVVDDNHSAAEALEILLSRFGYVVRVAHDGLEALEIAAEMLPEIALLDIGLPGMDGYALAARMRETCQGAPPCFIAISGYGDDTFRRRSAEAGFDEHMVKPVGVDALLESMARACGPAPAPPR